MTAGMSCLTRSYSDTAVSCSQLGAFESLLHGFGLGATVCQSRLHVEIHMGNPFYFDSVGRLHVLWIGMIGTQTGLSHFFHVDT